MDIDFYYKSDNFPSGNFLLCGKGKIKSCRENNFIPKEIYGLFNIDMDISLIAPTNVTGNTILSDNSKSSGEDPYVFLNICLPHSQNFNYIEKKFFSKFYNSNTDILLLKNGITFYKEDTDYWDSEKSFSEKEDWIESDDFIFNQIFHDTVDFYSDLLYHKYNGNLKDKNFLKLLNISNLNLLKKIIF
jgi:hypothetical protein